ncbi:uncharacterized protein MYCFIDRAFT_79564 [Pseudocercospora fijiensis CIRAD86]|uniref:Uncharacterized protein n=1 Tax=Pseudocercospora fijiensis (strain CIRAD86) TaxID=383855 RepID=M2ZJR4_PSEFD|nr:uncharacterized protein MYCFIDRAFT_79564 [Pseudocercospora fijiensis CIRAD86]EME79339.1 hypothetical protein MYCFIDRAFT_79564 [Pseudocercospora fijiensis CIRAD86]
MDTDTHLLAVWLKIILEQSELSCEVSAPALAAQITRFLQGRKYDLATVQEFTILLNGIFDTPISNWSHLIRVWQMLECLSHRTYDPRFIGPPLLYGDIFTFGSTHRQHKTQPVRASKARAQHLIHKSLEMKGRTKSMQWNSRRAALRQQNISFFTLPKEIRTMIYMNTILPNGTARVISVTEPFEPPKPNEAKIPTLAQTSQLIRAEIFELLPKFYRLNTFNITINKKADAERACAWLDTIPVSCRKALTRLVMTNPILRNGLGTPSVQALYKFRYTLHMDGEGKVIHYHRSFCSASRSTRYPSIHDDGRKFLAKTRGLETNVDFFKRCIMQAASGRFAHPRDGKNGVMCQNFEGCGDEMDTDWILGR